LVRNVLVGVIFVRNAFFSSCFLQNSKGVCACTIGSRRAKKENKNKDIGSREGK
jgi:hypothetical protein